MLFYAAISFIYDIPVKLVLVTLFKIGIYIYYKAPF